MPHHQRKIHYIDERVQKALLIALVLIEAVLVLGLCWILYRQLNQTVELNLYRIHLAGTEPLLDQLLHAALPLLAVFLLVNVIASGLVYWVWRRHMNAMLGEFKALVGKTRQLDFSPDAELSPYRHELLTLSAALRARERQRFSSIREQAASLGAEPAGSTDANRVCGALANIEALLPKQSS
jgi:hypothetical protein